MDHPPLSPLDRDWLDALAILARQVGRGPVLSINARWKPAVDRAQDHRCIWIYRERGGPEIYEGSVWITPRRFEDLPKIERVEVLLYAATALYFGDGTEGGSFSHPREAFVNLCLRVGCHHTNTPDIRERWRLMDWSTPAHLLPLAVFETRDLCRICRSPVATDAGAWITGELAGRKVRWNGDGSCESYRSEIHEECLRYAHRVLAPQLREARAADERMKARAANEVDK